MTGDIEMSNKNITNANTISATSFIGDIAQINNKINSRLSLGIDSGKQTLIAPSKTVLVDTTLDILGTSAITVTPEGAITSGVSINFFWIELISSKRFRIHLISPPDDDVDFNWILIQ